MQGVRRNWKLLKHRTKLKLQAIQGFIWNINSFDQEGVQLGKVLAKQFLTAMTAASDEGDSFEKRFLQSLFAPEQ